MRWMGSMNNSKNSNDTSTKVVFQLPLKGFHIEVVSPHPDWSRMIEGMGGNRFRMKVARIKK
jgi:hypothetical protein